ncbi:MAG: replicative DNA helicase [Elainellaceae cyanobacterium]
MVSEPVFESYSDRLPPQNIDAEETILGGILLDPEALGRIIDTLRPETFYISAHQEIYRAALALFAQGQPTDLMRVATWLRDNGVLEKVGGQGRLIQLVDRTVSAVNIDQYAQLVNDKALRRRLIQTGHEIAQMGYDTRSSLETVVDQAEQQLFAVTQDRPTQGLSPTSEILISTFADIENRAEGLVLPGIPSGFYDLDAMTQGFQRSDLIIAAGRPSMGKCLSADAEIVVADGSIKTIEEIYAEQDASLLTLGTDWRLTLTQPSVYVDDGLKPVLRVKTSTGRTIETTLSHPFLTIRGWQPLEALQVGQKIAVPRCLPVFGSQSMPEYRVKLLGYFIGDGSLTRTSPGFTNENPAIQSEFIESTLSFPGVMIRREDYDGMRTPSFFVVSDNQKVQTCRTAFAERLRDVLQASGKTAHWLAQQLGVSPSLVCQWQKGICAPDVTPFQKLCELLDVTPDHLAPDGLSTIRWMSQNALTLWLQEHHLWGTSAHEKTVPACVFRLPKPQLAIFLNRLFATDGWASVLASGQVQLGFATVCGQLARQVQHLLLRFGIIARLKSRLVKYQGNRRPAYQLDITDAPSIKTFIDEIGIFGKEATLEKAKGALVNRRYQTNRDLIPVEIWADLEQAKGQQTWKSLAVQAGLKGASNIHVGKRALSRDRLFALATASENEALQRIATSDVYWDEIVAIEPVGIKQVYDLTIPETHNFVANDICVHNTSFVLNIARNIAGGKPKLPIAVFSLEMSKEQLVYRLLSSEARVESGRLRGGRVGQQEWGPLGNAINTLSELPIFIDDTAGISVTEMRSKARRLQAEQGGALGLVLIDYLQLMEGTGSDNRVQELSKVTRSLKALARELSVPIIALSQLSRGVESRTNKRPMMSDLRECVTGDTLVWLADGRRVPIAELVGQTPAIVSMDKRGRLVKAQADLVWEVGTKPVYKLVTASGRGIKATGKHRLYTFDGWRRLQDLEVGDRLAAANHMPIMEKPAERWPDSRVALLAHLIGDGSYISHQPLRYTTASEENSQVVRSAAEEFGCTVNRHVGKGNWHQLVISGNGNRWHPAGVNLWLRELGIFNQRSAEKCVPNEVFRLPTDQIALFLCHLWATDGCISGYHHPNGRKYKASIFLSTISEGLARDVVALLLRLDIASQMQWAKAQCYTVHIYGKTQQLKFLDRVGAFGPRIVPAEEARTELLRRGKSNPNRDTLPNEVLDIVKQQMKAQGISQRRMATLRGTSYGGSSHFKFAPTRETVLSYAEILESAELKEIAKSDLFWDEIISIEPLGEEVVYDLTVPGPSSWMADGIVSHNSGSIEQDADLVLMLYRDEYYNPDSPDRGIAELIITKHRNGPVGTVKLLFEQQYTRFRNLAKPHGAE